MSPLLWALFAVMIVCLVIAAVSFTLNERDHRRYMRSRKYKRVKFPEED